MKLVYKGVLHYIYIRNTFTQYHIHQWEILSFLQYSWTSNVNLVNRSNLVHKFSYMQGGFRPAYQTVIYIVTNTMCRIGTVFSPDDGHIIARNT